MLITRPPNRLPSVVAVFNPSDAACRAQASPAMPSPTTIKSYIAKSDSPRNTSCFCAARRSTWRGRQRLRQRASDAAHVAKALGVADPIEIFQDLDRELAAGPATVAVVRGRELAVGFGGSSCFRSLCQSLHSAAQQEPVGHDLDGLAAAALAMQ